VRTRAEIVHQLNGHTLITDQGRYGLAFGRLTFHEELIVVKKAAPKKVVKKAATKKAAPKKVVKKAAPKKAATKKAPPKKGKSIS
jgi:hypothetical protein